MDQNLLLFTPRGKGITCVDALILPPALDALISTTTPHHWAYYSSSVLVPIPTTIHGLGVPVVCISARAVRP